MANDLQLKPVFGVHLGTYVYGQVVGRNGRSVSLRTPSGETKVLTTKVDEVAPIVCLLLNDAALPSRGLSRTKLHGMHTSILDRVLGTNNIRATRDVDEILDGIVPTGTVDDAARLSWIDAESKEEHSFSHHAINYTHFVDGDRVIPRSMRTTIGPSFMEEPKIPSMSAASTHDANNGNHETSSAPPEQSPALEALLAAFENDGVESATPTVSVGNSLQAELVALIAAKPHVLAFYLDQCLDSSRKRPAIDRIDVERPSHRPHPAAQLPPTPDHFGTDYHDRGRPQEYFRPSPLARAIHGAIVAPKYLGKLPSTFIDLTLSSHATEFNPHPGVMKRLYDIQFRPRGMSIAYLERYTKEARRQWRRTRRVASNTQGTSMDLPDAPQVTSLATLRDNLSVLAGFAQEFYNETTRELIRTACEFATTLTRAASWQPSDIEDLVDWFDDIFEQYRHAVESWVTTGHDERAAVSKRFAKSDPDFLLMLFNTQSEKPPRLQHGPRDGQQLRVDGQRGEYSRHDRANLRSSANEKTRNAKMPDNVYAALPRHQGKAVCLRFLSRRGCPSQSPDRCTSANLVHFKPEAIDVIAPRAAVECATFAVSNATVTSVQAILERRLQATETKRLAGLCGAFASAGVPAPIPVPHDDRAAIPTHNMASEMQRALSDLVRHDCLSLEDLVRLWRGESQDDTRPNKALDASWLSILLQEYPHRDRVLAVVERGVEHPFARPQEKRDVHQNHKSARTLVNALIRSLRKGQDDGTYLVLDLDATTAWTDLHFSPFGCIPKNDADPRIEARVIHDLSFPAGDSTNAATSQLHLPPIRYVHVQVLAQRIDELRRRFPSIKVKMMKGDVKGAFRHIPVAASIAHRFVGSFSERAAAVIDLALPFGWTGSPAFYGIFGGAITHLVSRESPSSLDVKCSDTENFFGYEWVDDHVLIEADRDERLQHGANALRLAMLAVLGPRAINESKFSPWSTKLTVLGLEWDTVACTVSMPEEKIAKAILRADEILRAARATKLQLSKLLGSFRHVCSCVRPAKPFYQRIVSLWRRCPPFGTIALSAVAALDIHWFSHILHAGRLRSIPTSFFGTLPQPTVHLYMDASNTGLCVLHPAAHEYLRLQFDEEEKTMITKCRVRASTTDPEFSINVREQLSAVLALLVWGDSWARPCASTLVHIRCWVDNSSAVAWCNSLSSRNEYSQELNRVIGAIEAQFNIRVSAEHIPGHSRTDPQDLQPQIVALQRQSLAETSQRTYASSWRQWCVYRRSVGLSIWLPEHDKDEQSLQLVAFAIHTAQTDRPTNQRPAFDTIRAKLSHIGWYHCVRYGRRPRLHDGHQLAMAGLRRANASVHRPRRAPVTIEHLRALAALTNFTQPQHRVLFGATLLGFFFLLRSAEYLAVDGRRHVYALEVRDVETVDNQGHITTNAKTATCVRMRLRGSKTDQLGTGTTHILQRSNEAPICPVFAAVLLLQNARDLKLEMESPLCTLPSGRMLPAKLVNQALRVAGEKSGTPRQSLSTHSLRIGGATALFQGGADELTIKHHGRWRSNAFVRYTRLTEPHGRQLTARMMGTQSPPV